MKEIRSFQCDKRPLLSEYQEALKIAQNDHCIIVLQWSVPWSGTYSEVVTDDMAEDELELLANKKYVYPL